MANKYWVGGAGTLDGATTTHISDSDGGAGGAAYPATTDDFYVTASSGTFPFTLTLSVSPTFASFNAAASSAIARLLLASSVVGTQRTITAAAVSLTDVDFTDITGAGAAAPFTGTRLGNAAGNSGITFTTAADKFYVGNTANWNGTVWALTSGGAAGADNFPLPQDTAYLDANSFSANGQTLTINGAFRLPSIVASGTDQTYTIATGTNAPTLYGSAYTLDSNATVSGTGALTFSGRNTQTITSAGKSWTQPFTINSIGGTVMLGDALTLPSTLTFTQTNGTLNLNGQILSIGYMVRNSAADVAPMVGNGGAITITGMNATVWSGGRNPSDEINVTLTGNGSNVATFGGLINSNINMAFTAGAITFSNGGVGNLDFTGAISWANPNFGLTIYGSLIFPAGFTLTAGTGLVTMAATSGTQVLTTNGVIYDRPFTINAPGATVQLADNLTLGSTRTLTHTAGTIDLAGQTLSTGRLATSGSTARTLTDSVGAGKIATTDTTAATVFDATTVTNLTIDRTNPWSIEIGGDTTNIRTMNLGAGKTWPAISFTNTTASGELDLVSSGVATVIKSLTVSTPPQTIKRTAGTTITVEDENGFPSGTAGNLVTVGSITAATHTWTKSGGGLVSRDYLSISRSTATPADTWYAGANSTDGLNNSGWTFAAPPTTDVKTFNGVIYASVKTVNGLAIASVKTRNGLA